MIRKLTPNRKIISFLFILALGSALFIAYFAQGNASSSPLAREIFARGILETTANNLVAAVYLNYRLFDTLLEALLLLVSVIGVSQFATLSSTEKQHPNRSVRPMPRGLNSSRVMIGSLIPVYMLISLFGTYVIITGMDGPGGGFQGGAILAAIVISTHFAEGRQLISIYAATLAEKSMYVLILAAGIVFLVTSTNWSYEHHRIYLLLINILIGLKVCAGLSLIYLHFMSLGSEETDEFKHR